MWAECQDCTHVGSECIGVVLGRVGLRFEETLEKSCVHFWTLLEGMLGDDGRAIEIEEFLLVFEHHLE